MLLWEDALGVCAVAICALGWRFRRRQLQESKSSKSLKLDRGRTLRSQQSMEFLRSSVTESFYTAISQFSLVDLDSLCDEDDTELKRIEELRTLAQAASVVDALPGGARWYESAELLRYVRARPNTEASFNMFKEGLSRRCEQARTWGVDVQKTGSCGAEHESLLSRKGQPGLPAWWTFLQAKFPLDLYGEDENGLPIIYFALGSVDLKGFNREVGLESIQKYVVYLNDYFFDLARSVRQRHTPSGADDTLYPLGGVAIVDMQGLGWDMRERVKLCGAIADGAKNMHPERSRRIFIVRAPKTFSIMWRLIKPLLEGDTADKVTILSANDSLDPLFTELGADYVPTFLGGNCKDVVQPPPPLCKGAFAKHEAESKAAKGL